MLRRCKCGDQFRQQQSETVLRRKIWWSSEEQCHVLMVLKLEEGKQKKVLFFCFFFLSKPIIGQSVLSVTKKKRERSSGFPSAVQYILFQLLSFPSSSKDLVLSFSLLPKQNNKDCRDQNYSTTQYSFLNKNQLVLHKTTAQPWTSLLFAVLCAQQ